MPLPNQTQVLIVGAGPTGLALACRLAIDGVPFVLIDRLAAPQRTSRAAAIHARTLETLEPLGVTPTLVSRGLQVTSVAMHDGGRTLARIPFSGLATRYPYILALPQNETEAILADRLRELGGTVNRGWEAAALRQDQHGAAVELKGPDGARQTIGAAYVVGADGYHSLVRSAAGIGFQTGTYPESFILADLHMNWPLGRDEGAGFLAREGLLFVIPLPSDHYRIIANVDNPPAEPSLRDVQTLLDERSLKRQRPIARDMIWSSRFRIHHGVAAQYRADRVFLAGDAAHVHSPAGGQGMNTGVQDALCLAEHLAAVLRDGAADAHLDRYQALRQPIARRVVSMTDRMTRMATITSPVGRMARGALLRAVGRIPPLRNRIAAAMAEIDLPCTSGSNHAG